MVLCCSFAKNPHPYFSGFKSLIGLLPFKVIPQTFLHFFLLGSYANHSLSSELFQAFLQVSSSTFHARLKAVLSNDVSEKLSKITAPILYLQAPKDRIVLSTASEFILLKNTKTKIIQIKTPHFLLQTSPKYTAKVVNDFIRNTKDLI